MSRFLSQVHGYSDMAFNQHFVLDYNSQDVMHSFPVDFDGLCVEVPRSLSVPLWAQMVRGFDTQVMVTYVVLSYALVAFFWFLNWAPLGSAGRRLPFRDSFWLVHAALCGAPAPFMPRRSSQRVFIGFCALFSVIATNAFQVNAYDIYF